MANDRKNQYIEMSVYFNRNCKEDMAIYRFLNASRRRKSKFIVRVLLHYLKQHGIDSLEMIESIPEEEIINFIEFNEFSPDYKLPEKIDVSVQNQNEILNALQKLLSKSTTTATSSNFVDVTNLKKTEINEKMEEVTNREAASIIDTSIERNIDVIEKEQLNKIESLNQIHEHLSKDDSSLPKDNFNEIEKDTTTTTSSFIHEEEINAIDELNDEFFKGTDSDSGLEELDGVSLVGNWEEGLKAFEI